ncbi:hypothetical protein U1Q18_025461, partial [Sarracenia purpurea var. burkii]
GVVGLRLPFLLLSFFPNSPLVFRFAAAPSPFSPLLVVAGDAGGQGWWHQHRLVLLLPNPLAPYLLSRSLFASLAFLPSFGGSG